MLPNTQAFSVEPQRWFLHFPHFLNDNEMLHRLCSVKLHYALQLQTPLSIASRWRAKCTWWSVQMTQDFGGMQLLGRVPFCIINRAPTEASRISAIYRTLDYMWHFAADLCLYRLLFILWWYFTCDSLIQSCLLYSCKVKKIGVLKNWCGVATGVLS